MSSFTPGILGDDNNRLINIELPAGTYPGNHQGVISTPKHKIFGKMTPSCILQDFLYLFESKEIFQKFHS